MITKCASAHFDPEARAPRWERFLREVLVTDNLVADENLIAFVKRAIGYSLTGDTSEHAFILMVGPRGANGKSVLLNVLSKLLGDYAVSLNAGALLLDRNGRNKGPELLPLLGARLALASEPNAGQRMDEEIIKNITGGDMLTVNPKYEKVFSFKPQAKLWLACNTPPPMANGGSPMARRINVVPFHRHFAEDERQKDLEQKLQNELSGILNWALKGCLEWQKDGLNPPSSVRIAGKEYADENDPLQGWLDAHVSREPGHAEPLSKALGSYTRWAEMRNFRPPSSRKFSGWIKAHGYVTKQMRGKLSHVLNVSITFPASDAEESAEARGNEGVTSQPLKTPPPKPSTPGRLRGVL